MTNLFPPKKRCYTAKRKLSKNTTEEAFIRSDVAPYANDLNSIKHLPLNNMTTVFRENDPSWIVWKRCQYRHVMPLAHQACRSFTNTYLGSPFLRKIIAGDQENTCHNFNSLLFPTEPAPMTAIFSRIGRVP